MRHLRHQEPSRSTPKPSKSPNDDLGGDGRCQDAPSENREKRSRRPLFPVPRLAQAPDLAQQQPQLIRGAFEGVRFAHVGLAAQPTPSPATGLAHMSKGSFASLAAPTV